jgi:hypothetical protein
MKPNKGKWDSQNETRKNYKKTKQNFAFDETKRNKAKFCCFLYRKTSEISQNNFFRFVYCFAKQKRMRTENPSQQEQDFPEHVFRGFSGAPAEMRTVLEQPQGAASLHLPRKWRSREQLLRSSRIMLEKNALREILLLREIQG